MVHNHYLDEAKKKTQERDRNSKPSVMAPARFQSTTADSKPKPRSTNHSSRSLPMSKSSCVTMTAMPKADHSKSPSSFSDHTRFFCFTCNKCVFNANPDACITKLLKEVNLRAKIQSHKTRDCNKPVDQKSHTQIPGRQIFTGHKFSPNKTSAVYEKISPRFDLSGFTNDAIVMASDQISSDPASECQTMASDQLSSDPEPECQTMAPDQLSSDPAPEFQTMASNQISSDPAPECQIVVSKSSAVSAADAPNQCQQYTTPLNNHTTHAPACQVPTLEPTVISSENINQAETYAENDQVADDEFINIFFTPVRDQGETSSRYVDSSNMHTFYQRFPSEHRWTKDHPLEQVIGKPSQPVRTRRQLKSDAEMCVFALIVSQTKPKNIKEAMEDSAWIESMQEELHQFDR
nr:retrovirus-related Pol polyprotein from transposon TNT 1-94 [Tanacetum cinerariifolium]